MILSIIWRTKSFQIIFRKYFLFAFKNCLNFPKLSWREFSFFYFYLQSFLLAYICFSQNIFSCRFEEMVCFIDERGASLAILCCQETHEVYTCEIMFNKNTNVLLSNDKNWWWMFPFIFSPSLKFFINTGKYIATVLKWRENIWLVEVNNFLKS